jgi:twitching motility protein PilJ
MNTSQPFSSISLDSDDAALVKEMHAQMNQEELLNEVMRASSLQQAGRTDEAIAIYQRIEASDPDGQYGAVARKSLESLGIETIVDKATADEIAFQNMASSQILAMPDREANNLLSRGLQKFYDLPIRQKQLGGLLISQAASVLGLVGVGTVLLVSGLRAQLLEQAKSELAAAGIQYNIKINQMGFGFRGQSDNPAVISAAKTGEVPPRLLTILRNETGVRSIEYATLVNRKGMILANANSNRRGEIFDPHGLVTKAIEQGGQLKTTATVSWAELQKERPLLPVGYPVGQDGLVRYVVTPVRDPESRQIVGALVAGDVVNHKWPIVLENAKIFKGGYTGLYLKNTDGSFQMASSAFINRADQEMHIPLGDDRILKAAVAAKGQVVTGQVKLRGASLSLAARALKGADGNVTGVLVRGTPERFLEELLANSLWTQTLTSALVIGLNVLLALLLTRAIARPIARLRSSAEQLAGGNRSVRAEVFAQDEIGELATAFNQMASNIAIQTSEVERVAEERRLEAEQQRQEAARLQERVINLLLEIDGASRGDLTVRARVTDDEMGSIADAFNASVGSLQALVIQVQKVAQQVGESAVLSDTSVGQFSQAALQQSKSIALALSSVEDMVESIDSVATSAVQAAQIARQASVAATAGGEAMEHTVESINDLRGSVAETSKKVKRLTESSQEISKVVALISDISAKTNLLAFNASIEAVRAGENGQGFRIVADEVRRLAEQVTNATKEIEQLVGGIQVETAEVLTMMEKGTAQVVRGSQLVSQTRATLTELVSVSQQIDGLVQTISDRTATQTETSHQVSQTIQSVAAVADTTSTESQAVSDTLKQLLEVSTQLQNSVARFRVTK